LKSGTYIAISLALVVAIALSGCALSKRRGQGQALCGQPPMDATQAFQKTLHPVLVTSCSSCHGDTPSAPYLLAQQDPAKAMPIAQGFVVTGNPAQSRIVERMAVDRHQCGGSCDSLAVEFKTQIAAWAKLMTTGSLAKCADDPEDLGDDDIPRTVDPAKVVTGPIAVPVTITGPAQRLQWDLSSLRADLAGAHLRISASREFLPSDGFQGTFILSNLILGTSVKKFQIRDVQIILNGVPSEYLNFTLLNFVVAPLAFTVASNTWPFIPVTPFTQSIVFSGAPSDNVQLAFFIDETNLPPGVVIDSNLTEDQFFYQRVNPIFTSSCSGCHNNMARTFYLGGNDLSDYNISKTMIDLVTPANSQILRKATNAVAHNGGQVFAVGSSSYNTIVEWVNKVAAAPVAQ